ncbi:MAG: hypothetical protein WC483_05690 [Candidatus Paceibacterota bacterium]
MADANPKIIEKKVQSFYPDLWMRNPRGRIVGVQGIKVPELMAKGFLFTDRDGNLLPTEERNGRLYPVNMDKCAMPLSRGKKPKDGRTLPPQPAAEGEGPKPEPKGPKEK